VTARLHLCRTDTEACLGAFAATPPGFVVSLGEEDGIRYARAATSTLFGPVDRRFTDPERDILDSLVVDTLAAGEHDVWLVADGDEAERLSGRALEAGFEVVPAPAAAPPPGLPDPFSTLALLRRRAEATSRDGRPVVMSYCKMFLDDHPLPVEPGDRLAMGVRADGDGSEVFYVDADGEYVGTHGRIPYPVDDDSAARMRRVSVTVGYTSWGRDWKDGAIVPVQTIMFDLPADVDALLSDAKLPDEKPKGAGGPRD
jgi:hypothetical protein